jgi:hypothetical protein
VMTPQGPAVMEINNGFGGGFPGGGFPGGYGGYGGGRGSYSLGS